MAAQSGKPRVLDVGQCDFDHGNISRVLGTRFGAVVERCHSAEEAMRLTSNDHYDLVLVNRIFDRDGDEGLKLIARLQSNKEPAGRPSPVMLVSNFSDAQAQAVQAGAVPGFGKAALESETTMQTLSQFLNAHREQAASPAT